jgi:hypothetical protein
MRVIPLPAAMVGAATLLAASAAMAQYAPWCAVYTGETGPHCAFVTREQCTAVAGIKGVCIRNSQAATVDKPASVAIRPARKQADAKSDAKSDAKPAAKPAGPKLASPKPGPTISRDANTGTSTRPDTRPSIPPLDRALLMPPPDFNCEFKAADTDPGADVAVQMKLDYERQCYRHAAMIADDRLRSLQASVGERIRVVDRVPLPDRALLAPPAEFDCEFKTVAPDDPRGAPQPNAAGAQAGSGADGALRTKLDYERQCYQHAEMIARDRLRRLQAAVGETIKAVR